MFDKILVSLKEIIEELKEFLDVKSLRVEIVLYWPKLIAGVIILFIFYFISSIESSDFFWFGNLESQKYQNRLHIWLLMKSRKRSKQHLTKLASRYHSRIDRFLFNPHLPTIYQGQSK